MGMGSSVWDWIKSEWAWIQFDTKRVNDLEDRVGKIEKVFADQINSVTAGLKANDAEEAAALKAAQK